MNTIILSSLIPAVYCRKSTESEERQILSLPAQREEAVKITNQLGIFNLVHYEESKSAKISGQRPVFARMIKELRRNKVNAIVCWKLDRLARNMIEGGEIIDMLQRGVIKAIITPSKVYYPNENALLMAVEFGAANQYSRDLSQNVKRGQVRKAKDGYPGGRACIGFLNDQYGEKGQKKWIADEERLPVLKEMFAMYLTGCHSGGTIHKWARDVGKLTTPKHKKSGSQLISRAGVYRMLCDSLYAGFFYVQGERYELAKELPRVISESEHYKIVAMLGRKGVSRPKAHDVIYSDFIESPIGEYLGPDIKMQLICDCKYKFSYLNKSYCPKCNVEISGLQNPRYLFYTYYRNVSKAKRQEPVKYLSEMHITKQLMNYIRGNLVFSTNLVEWCTRHVNLLEEASNEEAIIENRKKRIFSLQCKKTKYRDMLADGIISADEYSIDIAKINREISNLGEVVTLRSITDAATEVFTLGNELNETYEFGTLSYKRHSLSRLGANLIWDEKNLVIICKKLIQTVIDKLNEAKHKNDQFEPKTTLADKDETGVFADVSPILRRMCADVRNIILEEAEK